MRFYPLTPDRWEDFASLNRSPVLKSIDDQPVWSIVCFFVAKEQRGFGATEQLIAGAVDYVRRNGGRIVEAYPSIPRSEGVPPVSSYMGFPKMFERMGFVEAARPSDAKCIMRYHL